MSERVDEFNHCDFCLEINCYFTFFIGKFSAKTHSNCVYQDTLQPFEYQAEKMINNPLGLPTPALVSILSMLDASEVNIFKRLEKRTNEFYNRHKKMIDCDVMLKKIENDPAALFYLNKSVKKDPTRQEALAAFATDGQVLRGRNGGPLLSSLVDAYRDYLSLKNRIEKNDLPTRIDGFEFNNKLHKILKVFDNKIYVSCDSDVKVCDLKTKTITSLEGTPGYVSLFKLDKINKRLYLGTNNLLSWDLANSKIFKQFTNDSKMSSFLLDNEDLYIGYESGKIALFHPETGKILKEFKAHEKGPVTDIKKMGNYLLSFSEKKIKFWDSTTLEVLNEIEVRAAFGCSFINNYMFLNQACDTHKNILVYDISNVNNIQRVAKLKDEHYYFQALPSKVTLVGNYLFTTIDSPLLFPDSQQLVDQWTRVWNFKNNNNEQNFNLIKEYERKSSYLFRMKPEKQFICETVTLMDLDAVGVHDYSSPPLTESKSEEK